MISIKDATEAELVIIKDIAYKTWPSTYGSILSKAQLDYMLELFYSAEALKDNIANGDQFLIASEGKIPLGFASYHHNYKQLPVTRIPKIYVLPDAQGKGVGRALLDEIESRAKANGSSTISLNVNRFNIALGFYQKMGFNIAAKEDIELDHGYLMEDFIMEKQISKFTGTP